MTTKVNADTSGGLKLTSDTSGTLELQSAGNTKLTVNSSGASVTTMTASGIIKTDDTTAATSTTDGSLQTDGGLSVAGDAVVGDDLLLLSDGAIMKFGADSEIVLTHVADTGLRFSDSDQLQFGDGGDLQLYHDGSNSYIDENGTGQLNIRTINGASINLISGSEFMVQSVSDGAVTLYHNGSAKLATAAAGVAVTGGITGATSISGGALGGRRNAIYNPTFSVNQRFGTGANTTMNTYAMDRWRCFGGGTGAAHSWTTRSDAGEGDQHYSRFQRPKDNTVTHVMGITQGLETIDSRYFAGKEVTLSFRARGGADWSPTNGTVGFGLAGGEGTDENPVSMTNTDTVFRIDASIPQGGGFVQYSGTGTVPADKTQLSLQISWSPVGTAGDDDYWDVREVQLELGDTVTQFEQRTFGEELALCQRYCFVMAPSTNAAVALAFARTTTVAFAIVELPVTMRTTPSLAFSSATDFQVQYLGSVATTTAMAASPELHKNMIAFTATVSSGLTAGQGMYIRDLNGGATITASAEL